jgi:hypothetical protein
VVVGTFARRSASKVGDETTYPVYPQLVDLHPLFGVVALASLFGADGFAIGCVVGFGVRWRGADNKTAWIVIGGVVT